MDLQVSSKSIYFLISPILISYSITQGHLSADALNTLRTSSDVEAIAEDGIMHTMATQTDAPWGLQRISSVPKIASTDTSALTYTYTYDESAGTGVDVYIVGM